MRWLKAEERAADKSKMQFWGILVNMLVSELLLFKEVHRKKI
jgi:hypothetical protein